MTKAEVIKLIRKMQGSASIRAFAREIGVSAAYLSDIYHNKRNPGPRVLEALRLVRETKTRYRRA